MQRELRFDNSELTVICRAFNVRRLAVFGSSLGSEFREDSDLDILVEFELGRAPGFAFVELQDRLSKLFGAKVDLNTAKSLSRYFRFEVESQAETLYEAA